MEPTASGNVTFDTEYPIENNDAFVEEGIKSYKNH